MLKPIPDKEKDIPAVALSMVSSFIGGVAFVAAGDVAKWSLLFWALFVILGTIFFIIGILLAFKPIQRANARQEKLENKLVQVTQDLSLSRIQNLQLHLTYLKLNLIENTLKIEKNPLLRSHYESILTSIETRYRNIQNELNDEFIK